MLIDNLLEILKIDLAARQDKYGSIYTTIGGNAKELFYLMTHEISVIKTENDEILIKKAPELSIVDIYFPVHLLLDQWSLSEIRNKLSEYIALDQGAIDCSFQDLIDLEFLEDYVFISRDIKKLHECVSLTKKLKSQLIENSKNKLSSLNENQKILAQYIAGYPSPVQALCVRLIIGIKDVLEFQLDNYLLSSTNNESISKLSVMKLMNT